MSSNEKIYRPKLTASEYELLGALAEDVGFYVDRQGRHYGNPSPGKLLTTLATAYATNPTAVAAALRELGIVGEGKPPERG